MAATGAARHNPLPAEVPPGGGPPAPEGATVVVQGSGNLSIVAVAAVDGLQGIGSGGGGPGPGPALSVTVVEEFIGCHVINMGCFFL